MARWDPPHVICRVMLYLQAKVLGKVPFWLFLTQKWVWPYRYAFDVPLVTLILNIYIYIYIYIWVGGSSSILFSGKNTIFGYFFNTERGVAIWTCS